MDGIGVTSGEFLDVVVGVLVLGAEEDVAGLGLGRAALELELEDLVGHGEVEADEVLLLLDEVFDLGVLPGECLRVLLELLVELQAHVSDVADLKS